MDNLYARTARFFVINRQLSLLLILASFAFGILAFVATPKQYNPEITLPAFRIVTAFPGATAEEVERLVTSEIENKLAEIPDVDDITSQSFAGGQSVVSVTFTIGSDLEASKTKVTEKMTSNLALAPLGVGAPIISQINPENVPVMSIAITSDHYPAEGLRAFAYDLREQLADVPGVTNVAITGGRARQLTALLDPARLAMRGVAANDVAQIIAANNLRVQAGSLEGATTNMSLAINGTLTDGIQLGRIVVGGTAEAPVYLADVAIIDDGYEVIENYVGFRTRETTDATHAVYLSFAKTAGTNISDVTEAVRERLAAIQKDFVPDGIDLTITRDEGATAHDEIVMLTEHLTLAIIIVTVTLMLFLGWRAALVVGAAIPLTLALVFIIGYVFDQSINRITLFALIFSLGLLVDDAIVVIENIYRHFGKRHASITDAIAAATGEVGMGVLLATVTAVIVFVPMGLVTGMMGAYMGPIAFFAPVARLASLVVAYTFSPYLASIFLRTSDAHDETRRAPIDVWYRRLISRILDSRRAQHVILIATTLIVLVTFSFPVIELVHFRMLPKADKEQVYVYLDAPVGTPLSRTHDYATQIEGAMLAQPDVMSVETFVATPPIIDFNGLFRGSDTRTQPEQATLKINLTPKDERDETSEAITAQLRPIIARAFTDEPDVRVKLVEDPPGPPVLSTLLARVKGADTATREAIARDLYALFRTTPGVVDLDTSLPTGASETRLTIDHEKLTRSGLSVAAVTQAIDIATRGQAIAFAHLGTRERTNIVVRFEKTARDEIGDLARIELRNSAGTMIALGSVVRMETTTAPTPIWHDAREPMTIVAGEMSGRSVVYAAKDVIIALLDYHGPDGRLVRTGWNLFGLTYRDTETRETYRIEWGGEFEMTLENFRDLGLAMLISYFLIYAVLVAQFRSFRSPALIMTTIILGFAGVLPGFAVLDAVSGVYFSATSMIGIIALGGIVVGNAILLLDFIEQLRARGLTTKGAIIDACQTRLRPIMLTSVTAVLGSIVIVADPVWSGLAWAITFGLSLSTILTLVIFPVLYFRFGEVDEAA